MVSNPGLPLCSLCKHQIAGAAVASVEDIQHPFECTLCFGLLDQQFIDEVASEVQRSLSNVPYDVSSFALALNLPVTQVLREAIIMKSRPDLNGILATVPYKIRNINAYLGALSKASGLTPTLSSNLQLTITFDNDEFNDYDMNFLTEHFPSDFYQGKKRKFQEDVPRQCTKMRLEHILGRIKEDIARKYVLLKPTRKCSFTLSFEHNPIYIAGRYCKFSRSLPQSPWSVEEKDGPKIPGNSVSEKICDLMKEEFGASDARFVASGREDIDVRMLGEGRPFAVELRNCKITKPLNGFVCPHLFFKTYLRSLTTIFNLYFIVYIAVFKGNLIFRQIITFSDKKKSYTAYCYSTIPLFSESFDAAVKQIPLDIIQKTPVRTRNTSGNICQGICSWGFWSYSAITRRLTGCSAWRSGYFGT
uniref:tRNA pseudouridine(55) synthase n=1 Tax=Heterorhabditis bacteriophora TaxID=37862 RepID=A0A1I7XBD5_HETBA